jgi:hypothetical protein
MGGLRPVVDSADWERGCYTDNGISGYGVAVQISRKTSMSDGFVRQMAEDMMLSIAHKCLELKARSIGHIKSVIKTEAGTIKADTIGIAHGAYSTGKFDYPVKHLYMAINSIVQGIPEEAVKAATLEGIYQTVEEHGLLVVKEKEHMFFDEFEHTTLNDLFIQQSEELLSVNDPDEDF